MGARCVGIPRKNVTANETMEEPENMEEVIKESGDRWMESITMWCSSNLWCTQRQSVDFMMRLDAGVGSVGRESVCGL